MLTAVGNLKEAQIRLAEIASKVVSNLRQDGNNC
ncbi:hypothetical protein Ple7327_3657 [Pleurocapsa sp. PCC 7327]|nr:hypothetical protein Ple7327_3657 [Pleurocapsa sp. PCC 7327]